jgi:plastocyanin
MSTSGPPRGRVAACQTLTPPSAARILAILILAAAVLAGCGSSASSSSPATTTGAPASPSGTVTVTIVDFAFDPADFTVAPGALITVINKDKVIHTLTALPGSHPQGTFDTGNLQQNQTATIRAPTVPGAYQYYCVIHNYMTGTLTVS